MTEILVKRDQSGSIEYFRLSGHTGSAPSGEDIVCAGLSSVVWTVLNGLETVLSLPISYEIRDGFTECTLPALSQKEREKADVLLCSMDAFLDEMIRQYGDFIVKTEV